MTYKTMESKTIENEWIDDFKEFLSSEEVPVPENVSKKILTKVHSSMNPSSWIVFAKLLGIHSVFGTLSLAICNQFDLNPFNTSFSLSDYFMKLGDSFCMALCGFLFIGLSISFAWILLNRDEFQILRKNSTIQIFSLSLISLAGLAIFGANVIFGFALLWLLGAMIGGTLPILLIFQSKSLKAH